jgi:hypothetical protein
MSEPKYSTLPKYSALPTSEDGANSSPPSISPYEQSRNGLKNSTPMSVFYLIRSTTGIGFFTIQFAIVQVKFFPITPIERLYLEFPIERDNLLLGDLGASDDLHCL